MSNPLSRAAGVVDVIAASGGGLTLNVIAQLLRLPQSTTHRQIQGLISIGYVQIDPVTKTYGVGERLRRTLQMTLGAAPLKEVARPVLRSLADELLITSYLVRYGAGTIGLLDFVLPEKGSRTLVHPGFEFPFHATAVGKAIFAFLREDELAKAMAQGLPRFMENTIVDPALVREELAKVREQGYAINNVELDPGVLAMAAPIRLGNLGVCAALGVVGLQDRMNEKGIRDRAAAGLTAGAEEISMLFMAKHRQAGPA